MGPEAAVEAESKFIEVALQMLFTNAVVSSQEEGLRIGDQDVYPAQSAAVFIKDLIVMVVRILKRSPGDRRKVCVIDAK